MIYLASPYSDPDPAVREERYRIVRNLAFAFRNVGVFSPILYCHRAAIELNDKTDAATYLKMNTAFQKAAHSVWLVTIDGWKDSKGCRKEVSLARHMNQPVLLIDSYGRTIAVPREDLPTWF